MLYVIAMIILIGGVDILIFRHHPWPRLMANIGIVLLFGAFYLRFIKGS
ncbi:hypothetical protein [Nocardia sp. NBC_00511]